MRYREQRFPSDIDLRFVYEGEVRRVRLLNVSTSGARLECSMRLPRDIMITLWYLNERMPAYVKWSNDRQTGVRFTEPLSQASVNALRGAGGSSSLQWGIWGHRPRELS